MPQLTFPVTPAGLAVPVLVGVDGKTTAALHAAGRPIPLPISAPGLLDTCSDLTAIAPWVFQQLAIPPATTATTQTAGGMLSRPRKGELSPRSPVGRESITHPGTATLCLDDS